MHLQTQHGVAKGGLGSEVDNADWGGEEPYTYKMAFPTRTGHMPCQVEGCSVWLLTHTAMKVHF